MIIFSPFLMRPTHTFLNHQCDGQERKKDGWCITRVEHAPQDQTTGGMDGWMYGVLLSMRRPIMVCRMQVSSHSVLVFPSSFPGRLASLVACQWQVTR